MARWQGVWLTSLELTSNLPQPPALESKRFTLYNLTLRNVNNVIKQTKFSRLEAPYDSECISEWSSTNYSSFTGDKSWTYTEEVGIVSFASRGTLRNHKFRPSYVFVVFGGGERGLILEISRVRTVAMQASVPSFLNLDGLRLPLPPGWSHFWK